MNAFSWVSQAVIETQHRAQKLGFTRLRVRGLVSYCLARRMLDDPRCHTRVDSSKYPEFVVAGTPLTVVRGDRERLVLWIVTTPMPNVFSSNEQPNPTLP